MFREAMIWKLMFWEVWKFMTIAKKWRSPPDHRHIEGFTEMNKFSVSLVRLLGLKKSKYSVQYHTCWLPVVSHLLIPLLLLVLQMVLEFNTQSITSYVGILSIRYSLYCNNATLSPRKSVKTSWIVEMFGRGEGARRIISNCSFLFGLSKKRDTGNKQ